MERLAACEFTKLAVTDTIPIGNRADAIKDRLVVLSVADLLGEAIHRIHHNESVSALFRRRRSKRRGIQKPESRALKPIQNCRFNRHLKLDYKEIHHGSKPHKSPSSPAPSSARAPTSGCAMPGFVPGVIYGHKEAVVPVTLPKKELANHLDHGAHLFDLALDGKSEKVLVKEVQYDHLGIEVIHVDFARVSLDEKVKSPCRSNSRARPRAKPTAACFSRSSASWKSSAWSPTSPT